MLRFPLRILISLAVAVLVMLAAAAADSPIKNVQVPETVDRYAMLEIEVDLAFAAGSEDAAVDARLISPSGRETVVHGFEYQEFERSLEENQERLTPTRPPAFRVRFTPDEVGAWRGDIWVRTPTGRSTQEFSFACFESSSHGFVRVAPNHTHFAFDDGTSYFAVGENVCWSGSRGTFDYDDWFAKLAEQGANYARLWIGPFNSFTLEREFSGPAFDGLGVQDPASAWRLDQVLRLAEKHGIYLVLCTRSFNALRTRPEYPMWKDNPYNRVNGGPLERPQEFFTDPLANDQYRILLRYLVARYGYSTNVLAWEFWNEVDLVDGYDSKMVEAWHKEMARDLRAMDPYRHLITTSFANSDGDGLVDALAGIDYVQTHNYGALDEAATLSAFCRQKSRLYKKPTLVGEYGVDTHVQGNSADPEGVHLHNGLWAPVFSQSAGTGMIWWWDNYVDPGKLYPLFGAIARFVKDVPWATHTWKPLAAAEIAWAEVPPTRPGKRLKVLGGTGFGVVTSTMPDREDRFVLDVQGVTPPGANLRVLLDGEPALQQAFPVNDEVETHQYDGAYAIHVAPGKHNFHVRNLGPGNITLTYAMESAPEMRRPNLLVLAQDGGNYAIAWLQNRDHTWHHARQGLVRPVPRSRVTLAGLRDGNWRVEWWDTTRGVATGTTEASCKKGRLTLVTPTITTDVACKLQLSGAR